MNWKMLSIFIAACFSVVLVAFVSKKAGKGDFDSAKELIVMRKIAHDVLRYTGDSISVIQPVKQISATEFEVTFSSSFSFKPDSIVSIVDKLIAANKLPPDYIVQVLECKTGALAFGYAVLGTEDAAIVPCLGREQPAKDYCIHIKFEEEASASPYLYLGGIGLLGIGLFIYGMKRTKKRPPIQHVKEAGEALVGKQVISIGQYKFYPAQQLLVLNNEEIMLTLKESKLLSIFAAEPNQVIDRNQLQKVWEDEGVIVTRSLDMFVSKLRKRLENDPTVKLVNIHGKGYKLQIDPIV